MVSVWVDETKSKSFVLVAVELEAESAAGARKELRDRLLPGQRSIHFAKESDRRRKQLLKDWAQLAKSVYIVDTQLKDAKQARRMAISILLSTLKPEFICIEKDESVLDSDSEILRRWRAQLREKKQDFEFRFETRNTEPLLWLPDGIGWAYQRGDSYRFFRQLYNLRLITP